MITYKITTAFQADWDNLFKSLFGSNQHVYSQVSGNEGTFGFSTPQTPADLGPLVKVELIPNP